MFLNDYYLYINFFLQYPMLTEKNIHAGMTFESILDEYRKIKMRGMVYRFIEEVEYVLVVGQEQDEEDEDSDMIREICEIENEIQLYKNTEDSIESIEW